MSGVSFNCRLALRWKKKRASKRAFSSSRPARKKKKTRGDDLFSGAKVRLWFSLFFAPWCNSGFPHPSRSETLHSWPRKRGRKGRKRGKERKEKVRFGFWWRDFGDGRGCVDWPPAMDSWLQEESEKSGKASWRRNWGGCGGTVTVSCT